MDPDTVAMTAEDTISVREIRAGGWIRISAAFIDFMAVRDDPYGKGVREAVFRGDDYWLVQSVKQPQLDRTEVGILVRGQTLWHLLPSDWNVDIRKHPPPAAVREYNFKPSGLWNCYELHERLRALDLFEYHEGLMQDCSPIPEAGDRNSVWVEYFRDRQNRMALLKVAVEQTDRDPELVAYLASVCEYYQQKADEFSRRAGK